jgi:hypothetical protein
MPQLLHQYLPPALDTLPARPDRFLYDQVFPELRCVPFVGAVLFSRFNQICRNPYREFFLSSALVRL